MSEQARNPKNAPGPFYVVKGQCISCGAPQSEAPGLITFDDDGCYFHKQPESAAEVNDALRAMFVSCVESYRYAGTDPDIRRRLAELGHPRLCDQPLEGHPVLIRNRIRFSLGPHEQASEVATALLSAFLKTWEDGKCTKAVHGDADRAEFEFTSSAKYAVPRRYIVDRVSQPRRGTPSSIYRDSAMVHLWLLTEDEERYPPIWLHDVLTKNGAVGIRWFSRHEWNTRAAGSELPY